jgi:hypothetical protein
MVLRGRFETRLRELRAAGVTLTLAEHAPSPVADADNAAPILAEADAWYEANDDGPFATLDGCWTDEDHEAVADWATKLAPYVEMLQRAAAMPAYRAPVENPLEMLLDFALPGTTREKTFVDALASSWLARPLAYRDALTLLDARARWLAIAALPPREVRAKSAALVDDAEFRSITTLFSSLWVTLPRKAILDQQRNAARIRVARVGLALLVLRQETDAWPESLDADAVVSLVGAEAIVDPFTGGRLAYEPGVLIAADAPIEHEDLRDEFEIVWRFG